MRLIWKLLRKHVSGVQMVGFFVTNLLGLAIILTAVQFYRDVRPVVEAPDSFMRGDYVILSKRAAGPFSVDEIADLGGQPFVGSLGGFAAARYRVEGGLRMMGAGFQTALFFESVPDRFLDVASDRWTWAEGDRAIPIILPRNYLNLYNFGFAAAHGLPQLSEQVLENIPLTLTIADRERFEGRVVAFSNRINTILVPENFLDWSNGRFGEGVPVQPSRLIVETRSAADDRLQTYLAEHDYLPEGERPYGAGRLLRTAAAVIGGVGAVIALLATALLILSILLLLQKNRSKIENLLLLGYPRETIARPYIILIAMLNALSLAGAIPLLLWVRGIYLPALGHGHGVALWPTPAYGLVLIFIVTLINGAVVFDHVFRAEYKAPAQ